MYPNALELQNGTSITYSWRLELTDKPNHMPNHSVFLVNWSNYASMELFFIELSKTVKMLWHSRKTKTRREILLGQGGLNEHETIEYFKMEFGYRHKCMISYFSNYLGSNVNKSCMWPKSHHRFDECFYLLKKHYLCQPCVLVNWYATPCYKSCICTASH